MINLLLLHNFFIRQGYTTVVNVCKVQKKALQTLQSKYILDRV